LTKGQVITVNTLGLFGNQISEREKDKPGSGLDGFTYFGSMATVTDNTGAGSRGSDGPQVTVNDFVIPNRGSDASE